MYSEILNGLNNSVALFTTDDAGENWTIKYINNAFEQSEMIQAENVIGRNVCDVFPQIKNSGLYDVCCKVRESGEPQHHVTKLYTNGRVTGWRDNYVYTISTNDIAVTFTDESELQKVQGALKESDIFFERIFDTIQDGIVVLDTDMNIIQMNSCMEQWYYPEYPFVGNQCHNVFHGSDTVCENCPAIKALNSGKPHVKQVPRGGPEGTPGWIELSAFPIINTEGETIGVVEHVRNITLRKKTQIALKHSEQKFKDIINFLPEPTWVIDKEGKVIQWNHAIENLTGIKFEEIIGKGDFEYALPFYNERRPILIDLVLNPDEKLDHMYPFLEKSGDMLISAELYHPSLRQDGIYLWGAASPLFDSDGEIVGAIETLRDITDRKKVEEERERLIAELKEAMAKVRTLSGFLPICAKCKKIRDDDGYWKQIESYIREHSNAEFSHGLCPGCLENMYGEQDWFKDIIWDDE